MVSSGAEARILILIFCVTARLKPCPDTNPHLTAPFGALRLLRAGSETGVVPFPSASLPELSCRTTTCGIPLLAKEARSGAPRHHGVGGCGIPPFAKYAKDGAPARSASEVKIQRIRHLWNPTLRKVRE